MPRPRSTERTRADARAPSFWQVDVAVALDQQPLGPAVQGDDAAPLAGALVEIDPPPAHGRR